MASVHRFVARLTVSKNVSRSVVKVLVQLVPVLGLMSSETSPAARYQTQ
jgi:hypothetical protein